MRLALVHDELLVPAGSERVFLAMVEEFPEADIFTLSYNPATTCPEFRRHAHRIRTTVANRFIRSHAVFKMAFPLATYVMESLDLRNYDVVLTSSAHVAKYVNKIKGRHICYCYFPTRALWNPEPYFGQDRSFKVRAFRALMPYLKRRDYAAAQRVDQFVAISQSSRQAILDFYHRDADVLFSPIDFDGFAAGRSEAKDDAYLLVSRLETWKRVDFAILAFNKLGRRLRIVGAGPEEAALRAMAGPTIEFIGRIGDAELVREYGRARAVVFTPELEYGLVPLEANAAGTPVIALGRGGVLETMREDLSAEFFYEQTPEALAEAVLRFEKRSFDRDALIEHARPFGNAIFRKKLRALVENRPWKDIVA